MAKNKPGQLGKINRQTASATIKKNAANTQLQSSSILPGFMLYRPASNGVAPPRAWLVSK